MTDPRQSFIDEYNAAMTAERELWEKLQTKRPNTREHRQVWDQWMAAAARTTAASKALREVFSGDSKPGGLG